MLNQVIDNKWLTNHLFCLMQCQSNVVVLNEMPEFLSKHPNKITLETSYFYSFILSIKEYVDEYIIQFLLTEEELQLDSYYWAIMRKGPAFWIPGNKTWLIIRSGLTSFSSEL